MTAVLTLGAVSKGSGKSRRSLGHTLRITAVKPHFHSTGMDTMKKNRTANNFK